jgi:diguanylate cyclase (GGDEF)-like protein
MIGHLTFVTVLSGIAVSVRDDDPYLRVLWVTGAILCWGLGFFVNALVGDLYLQVRYDELTGLLNRTGLDLVAATRSGDRMEVLPRSVAVLDLEGFKAVNDRQGHQAGDQVLREVGSVLRSRIRPSDTAARTGGDEFVILLPFTPVDHANAVVTRVIDSLPIACSFGLADWPAGATFEEATRNADREMYAHKNRDTD